MDLLKQTAFFLLLLIFLFQLKGSIGGKVQANETNGTSSVARDSGSDSVPALSSSVLGDQESTLVNLEPDNQPLDKGRSPANYKLDHSTQIIFVDRNNSVGHLHGSTDAEKNDDSDRVTSKESGHDFIESPTKSVEVPTIRGTNFSIFLISTVAEHIAVLLDFEQIDLEPLINCENQEVRISIVGEISKQLLSKKNGTKTSSQQQVQDTYSSVEDVPVEESADQTTSAKSDAYDNNSPPPLPASEAMALLLNSPLNKTILDDSDDANDFKIIDSTIEHLIEETCHELSISNSSLPSGRLRQGRASRQTTERQDTSRAGRKSKRRRQRTSKRLRSKKKQPYRPETKCSYNSKPFKRLMTSKLNEHFEWDDFKIVCGKTRQLILPMRSLKLSVYSDEFAPNSNFTIRYQFVSDPSSLPALDNGLYYCRNRRVIELALQCNGVDDCGDGSDESIKFCGYPTGKGSSGHDSSTKPNKNPQAHQIESSSQQKGNSTSSPRHEGHQSIHRRKLTYVTGDVIRCCQSDDWISVLSGNRVSQAMSLHSFISDSMSLFSGPLFAPTSARRGQIRKKRIVGGGVAPRNTWPGQVSLQYELLEPLSHFCAGTLIHPQYVLTAGHCITKDGLNRGIKVVLGAHDLRDLNRDHVQERYVDDAVIYPGVDVRHMSYDWENDMNNDIALLRLNTPVLVTPQVTPACIPPFNTPLSINTSCRSIGWGQTHGSGSSNLLKNLNLKVVNSTMCSKELFEESNEAGQGNKAKSRRTRDDDSTALDQYSDLTMICVNNDLGHGICQGDSGGPLYCDRVTSTGEVCTEIYGVASFIIQYATIGAMCAVKNLPGIFGEVSSKTEWISSTMKMFEQTYRLKYS